LLLIISQAKMNEMKKAIIIGLLAIGTIGGGIAAYSQMTGKATSECCDTSLCCPEQPRCCSQEDCK
jgi:hypothetical protein